MMMTSPGSHKDVSGLEIEEVRLICDLRIMHSKLDELHNVNVVENLKRRHNETDIVSYSDYEVLAEDIRRMDDLYLWFVKIKEVRDVSIGD